MRTLTLLMLLSVVPLARPVAADTWRADPANSSISFSVRHLMINDVKGTFGAFETVLELDEESGVPERVEVTIEAQSLDTGHDGRDEHLRAPDFLDVQQFPRIRFEARRSGRDAGTMELTGPLTLHGVTKEVTIPLEISPSIRDPWGNERRGLVATLVVDRRDWGITWSEALDGGGLVVGNEVTVSAHLELVRRKE